MTHTITLQNGTSTPDTLLTAIIDTNTRKVTSIQIDPPDLATTFIALNALLGTLEAHLHLQHLNPPPHTLP
jgi:hypothetical protein